MTNGPTGAMPQDFWQKIGAAATTVVNSLVYVGQLIYKGLVALGTFLVNLASGSSKTLCGRDGSSMISDPRFFAPTLQGTRS